MNRFVNHFVRANLVILLGLVLRQLPAQEFVTDVADTESPSEPVFLSSGHLTGIEQFTARVASAETPALRHVVSFLDAAEPDILAARAENLLRQRRTGVTEGNEPLELVTADPARWLGEPLHVAGRLQQRQPYTIQADELRGDASAPLARVRLWLDVPWSDIDVVIDSPTDVDIEPGTALEATGIFFKVLEDADGNRAVMVVAETPDVVGDDAREDCGSVRNRRPLSADESAAYYRTLQRARLIPLKTLRERAAQLRRQRIDVLASEQPGRYARYKDEPGEFPTFVDIFKNTDSYACQPVTLQGRVREVLEYPADEHRHGLGTLYEVRLFPDDGQRNPAIVICTQLPDDFPRDANVVDGVSVTGYFFKMYAYRADNPEQPGRELTRIAPMILASQVTWSGDARAPASDVHRRILLAIAAVVFAIPLLYLVRAVLRERSSRARILGDQLPDQLADQLADQLPDPLPEQLELSEDSVAAGDREP